MRVDGSRRTRRVLGWVGLLAAQRVAELAWSRRNERRLRARGADEVGAEHYPAMLTLHTGWLGAMAVEAVRRPVRAPALRRIGVAVFALAQPLRYWAIGSLRDRWTTRVLVVPGEPPVATGPYRWMRHPNYAAVVMELAAAPLVVGAWRTAVAASIADLAVLRRRLAVETAALTMAAGPDQGVHREATPGHAVRPHHAPGGFVGSTAR